MIAIRRAFVVFLTAGSNRSAIFAATVSAAAMAMHTRTNPKFCRSSSINSFNGLTSMNIKMPGAYTQGIEHCNIISLLSSRLRLPEKAAKTVGIGITPILRCALADFTAGRESHPALKSYELDGNIPHPPALVKGRRMWYDKLKYFGLAF